MLDDRQHARVEGLDWDAFSARYFPARARHDLEAVAAYGAYREGRDCQVSGPPKLTLVPGPTPGRAESDDTAAERRLVAVSAEQAWEEDGGFIR